MNLAHRLRLFVFVALALVCTPRMSLAKTLPSPADRPTPAEEAIRRALDSPAKGSWSDTTLADFAAYLEAEYRIPVQLDRKALRDSGIAPDATLNAAGIDGMRLRTALELALRPLELTWTIYDDAILITTESEAENLLIVKVYDIENLIGRRDSRYYDDCQSLIDIITSTLAPTSWDEVGGPGAVQEYRRSGRAAIIISQTPQVHEEIAALLSALRSTRGDADNRQVRIARPHSLTTSSAGSKRKSARGRVHVYQAADWATPRVHP
jgi:hypothetical protein